MTTNALELVLHDLGVNRAARKAFAEDAPAFLARYRLTPAERGMVQTFDVAALQSRDVSPLLTYGFWMMNAPERSRAEYLRRLNDAAGDRQV